MFTVARDEERTTIGLLRVDMNHQLRQLLLLLRGQPLQVEINGFNLVPGELVVVVVVVKGSEFICGEVVGQGTGELQDESQCRPVANAALRQGEGVRQNTPAKHKRLLRWQNPLHLEQKLFNMGDGGVRVELEEEGAAEQGADRDGDGHAAHLLPFLIILLYLLLPVDIHLIFFLLLGAG